MRKCALPVALCAVVIVGAGVGMALALRGDMPETLWLQSGASVIRDAPDGNALDMDIVAVSWEGSHRYWIGSSSWGFRILRAVCGTDSQDNPSGSRDQTLVWVA